MRKQIIKVAKPTLIKGAIITQFASVSMNVAN